MSPVGRPSLPALVLALLAAGCGADGPEPGGPVAVGREVYLSSQCVQCHGERREGTEFAPPLKGLDRHWREEDLAEYFLDPWSVIREDPRLGTLSERFPMVMPPFKLEHGTRRDLARFLLSAEE